MGLSRLALPVYQGLVRRLHELTSLFFELTHDCNLRCLHCGSDCIRDPGAPRLSRDAVAAVLRDVKAHRDPGEVQVIFSGGEPLCHPELFELGRDATDLGFSWGMVTNGYALTPDNLRRVRAAGLRSITVSLDGLAGAHDWLRGRQGSHARAVAALSLLVADPFYGAMDVVTCVNRRNLRELRQTRDLLVGLGVPAWRLFTISPIGRAAGHPDLFLSRDEYGELLATIRALRAEGGLHVALSESGYLGCRDELEVRDHHYFCRAGINVGGVMVNGDILACPNIDRRFAQGNVHRESFVEVWEKKYEVFRDRSWMRTGDCERCGEWRHCQGNSFHLWDLDAGRTRLCHCREYGLL